MFTDNPTIPARLEVLLDVLHVMRDRKADKDAVRSLLQPQGLPGLSESSRQAEDHLGAAQQLGLVKADPSGSYRLTYKIRGEHDPKAAVLDAFDRVALSSPDIEPWASRFYAYLIVQSSGTVATSVEAQVMVTHAFNVDLPANVDRANPMNADKYRCLIRWYQYVGLGWLDPFGGFVPDPTERLVRVLGRVFGKERSLDSGEAISRIGSECPELDCGKLFVEVTSAYYTSADRNCTQALATALRNLHDQKVVRLSCPRDSMGWNLGRSGSVLVPGELESDRFDRVTLV